MRIRLAYDANYSAKIDQLDQRCIFISLLNDPFNQFIIALDPSTVALEEQYVEIAMDLVYRQ